LLRLYVLRAARQGLLFVNKKNRAAGAAKKLYDSVTGALAAAKSESGRAEYFKKELLRLP